MEVALAVRPYDSRDLEEQEASKDALFPIIKIGIEGEEAFFCYSPYNPETGRFLSEEPLGIDGPNLYWYGVNNPTNLIDPTGLAVSEVGPLGGGNAPVGPESCQGFYGDQCLGNPESTYYCAIAPSLCERLIPKPISNPGSDRSNCIGACLQRKEIEGSDVAGNCEDKNNNFIKHETDIHLECFRACSGTSF